MTRLHAGSSLLRIRRAAFALFFLATAVIVRLTPGVTAVAHSSSYPLNIPYVRVPPSERKFVSNAIDNVIANISARMTNPQLATLFQNTLPNTLDTTVIVAGYNDSFVITGDIDALWLRDSTNQVMPYIPYAAADANLSMLLQGLVLRQLRSLARQPYAEAFNYDDNGNGEQSDVNKPPMTGWIFEEKYEVDSLCAVVKLAHAVCSVLNCEFLGTEANLHVFLEAMDKLLTTFEVQQESTEEQNGTYPYTFWRASVDDRYPRLAVNHTGMVRSAFRPSDDDTMYDFLVPSNAMAVVSLSQLQTLLQNQVQPLLSPTSFEFELTEDFISRAQTLVQTISCGIESFAQYSNHSFSMLAYEVDGFGRYNFMDDANIPNLLSLPLIGFPYADYSTVRAWVLSPSNPWFFQGTVGEGVGSPHTGPDMIWPMSVVLRALTSTNDNEIMACLDTLLTSANNTGFMHESFNKNDVSNFTRPWFAWANTFFGSLILTLAEQRPHLIFGEA